MTRRLIIFTRAPLPGETKTRLAESIGEMEAAGVYARLLFPYLEELARADWDDVILQLSVASQEYAPFFALAFPEFQLCTQCVGDLGDRLATSLDEAFAAGAGSVVLTATDVPDLEVELIRAAFRELERAPAVIGPSPDGGYYLIGMRAPGVPLFDGVDWGSERVLEQTEKLARAAGLTMVRLPERLDIDTIDDLRAWHRATGALSP